MSDSDIDIYLNNCIYYQDTIVGQERGMFVVQYGDLIDAYSLIHEVKEMLDIQYEPV